jgi:hypothetical protein
MPSLAPKTVLVRKSVSLSGNCALFLLETGLYTDDLSKYEIS